MDKRNFSQPNPSRQVICPHKGCSAGFHPRGTLFCPDTGLPIQANKHWAKWLVIVAFMLAAAAGSYYLLSRNTPGEKTSAELAGRPPIGTQAKEPLSPAEADRTQPSPEPIPAIPENASAFPPNTPSLRDSPHRDVLPAQSPVSPPESVHRPPSPSPAIAPPTAAGGSSISGYVLDQDNNGIAGVEVTLSGASNLSSRTSSDGHYSFNGLPPNRSYAVQIKPAQKYFFRQKRKEVNLTGPTTANFVGSTFAAD